MRHVILTAEWAYPGAGPVAERAFAMFGGERPRGAAAGRTVKSPKVYAYVNEARWIAGCPFCLSAQVGSPEDPRFLCAECGNAAADGAFLPVVYPAGREQIEGVLAGRFLRANVNWLPGETVADLAAENVAHGAGG